VIDYKIINYMVADEGVQEFIENHRLLTDVDEDLWKKGALSVAARYCLNDVPSKSRDQTRGFWKPREKQGSRGLGVGLQCP
jgi:hypothetical protein